MFRKASLVLLLSLLVPQGTALPAMADEPAPRVLESFPPRLKARLETRDRKLRERAPRTINGQPLRFVIEDINRWSPGQTVRIGFMGGTRELHRQIADTATEWTRHGNLSLDFGLQQDTGEYRKWSPSDNEFTCEIRISFDQQGYWSLVGRDSVNTEVVDPGEASLNLEAFDVSLPGDWQATVLHEFGHAIGFHHEHQNPVGGCDGEFDWDRIYRYLAGPPNFWPASVVDHNLRSLPDSDMYIRSQHDPKSIMHYSFPDWMFKNGSASACYTPPNDILSEGDKAGMLVAYPKGTEQAERRIQQQESSVQNLLKVDRLSNMQRKNLQKRATELAPLKGRGTMPRR